MGVRLEMVWAPRCLFWAALLGVWGSVSGISLQDLFPFGSSAGDQTLKQGNDETQEVSLEKPVLFYNGRYSKIYVSMFYFTS